MPNKMNSKIDLASQALQQSQEDRSKPEKHSSLPPTAQQAQSKARSRKDREAALVRENTELKQTVEDLKLRQENLQSTIKDSGLDSQVGVYIEGEEVVAKLDPNIVVPCRFMNRLSLSFEDAAFHELKEDIALKGRNELPGKVRPITLPDGSAGFEAVFGHRRLKACQELGIEFHALVEEMDDATAIESMVRENDKRVEASAYEEGLRYKNWVEEEGIWSSYTALSKQIGKSKGYISQRVTILDLPDVIPQAIGDPRLLSLEQWRNINKRYIQAPEKMVTSAGKLADGNHEFMLLDKATVNARVKALLDDTAEPARKASASKQEFKTPDGARLFSTKRSHSIVEFDSRIDPATRNEAIKVLEEFLADRVK